MIVRALLIRCVLALTLLVGTSFVGALIAAAAAAGELFTSLEAPPTPEEVRAALAAGVRTFELDFDTPGASEAVAAIKTGGGRVTAYHVGGGGGRAWGSVKSGEFVRRYDEPKSFLALTADVRRLVELGADAVHFDNTRSPDNRGKDVRAFQRLWNRNHPGDKIGVDGDYGPQTAARLRRAPAKGFKKGAGCRSIERGADVLGIDGPDRVAPGELAHYTITVSNTHEVDWPATTKIMIADGAPSELHDPASWVSPTEVGTIGTSIPAGTDGEIIVDLLAPQAAEDTASSVTLVLVDGDLQLGTIDLAVTITPAGDAGTSGDTGDENDLDGDGSEDAADEDGVVAGGCNAADGGAGFAPLLGLLLIRRRRSKTY